MSDIEKLVRVPAQGTEPARSGHGSVIYVRPEQVKYVTAVLATGGVKSNIVLDDGTKIESAYPADTVMAVLKAAEEAATNKPIPVG